MEEIQKADGAKIIAIAGPTAVGKTALSIELAKRTGGEIVCCDSMQIYRGMDIGTAKPTQKEREQVAHHMLDILSPGEAFSCADFAAEAEKRISDILSRGRLPILCGGTGLYIESVLYKGNYLSPDSDESLRRRLAERSAQENYSELMRVDPESAASVHPNNVKRVIRALEIYMLSGKTKTEWDREDQRSHMRSGAKLFVLYCRDRDELYRRIDERVDVMMKSGLLDEVRSLMPFSSGSTAAQAIGYKELAGVLLGTKDLCEAVEEVKKASRNYAKRQLSWWRRNKDAIWVDTLSYKSVGDMADVLMSQINAD